MNSVRRQSRHQVPISHHTNPYYENDYPHYYGTLPSHDTFDHAYRPHHHASSSSYHSSFIPPPPHHPYPPPRSKYASDSYSRKRSASSKKRPRPYHETNQGNYKPGFGEKTIISPSSHSKDHHDQQYQYHQSHHNDSTEDEDEEFLTPLEAEALRNAELNKTVHDDATTTTSTGSIHQTNATTTATTDIDGPNATEMGTSAIEHQDPAVILSTGTTEPPFTKKKHDKALGALVSFFRRLASTKPHQRNKKQHAVKKTRQSKGMIQTMCVSTPLGDVMDQQQQQEVIQMLRQQQETPLNNNNNNDRPKPHDDATKVAALDHIWVFRCTNTNNNNNNNESAIWTGFDYENQVRLSQHSDDDNGIELYDTHIRKGLFPILVIPKRQVCFYAATTSSSSSNNNTDQVSSLQVACLPNSKNVQFVYRCGPPLPSNSGLVV